MIVDKYRSIIEERYNAAILGLKGALGIALHSETPLSQQTKKTLVKEVSRIAGGFVSDVEPVLKESVIDAVALSYDIALQNNYLIDESIVEWEALTDAIEDAQTALLDELRARIKSEASNTVGLYNRFRLNVSARTLTGEAMEHHILVSERIKLLSGASYKFVDDAGKRYESSYYVGKRIANAMFTLQRRTMYYLLISMNEQFGQISNPNRPNDGMRVELANYFDMERKLFNYNSRGLLVKSLLT